jgi:hypothetical protein
MNDGLWKTIAFVSLGIALAMGWLLFSNKGLYDFIAPRGNVVETARTALLRVERENNLVTTKAYVQAVVRKRSEEWYGNAEVIRLVPATIHYAVNLNEIDNSKLSYDAQTRVLRVPLPEVKIQSIDPDMTRAEIIRNIDLLRTEGITGNQLETETEKMIRPTLEELGKSSAIMNTAKEQAIVSVKQLLESALNATGQQVQVQPYFPNESKNAPTNNGK